MSAVTYNKTSTGFLHTYYILSFYVRLYVPSTLQQTRSPPPTSKTNKNAQPNRSTMTDPPTPPPEEQPPKPPPPLHAVNDEETLTLKRKDIISKLYHIFTTRWTVLADEQREKGNFADSDLSMAEKVEKLPEGKTFISCSCYLNIVLRHVHLWYVFMFFKISYLVKIISLVYLWYDFMFFKISYLVKFFCLVRNFYF